MPIPDVSGGPDDHPLGESSPWSVTRSSGAGQGHERLCLADDYYLLAHHGLSGRRPPAGAVVSLGLAAALLGDLMLAGWLTISGEELYPLRAGEPLRDRLQAEILKLVHDHPDERDLGLWLAHLAHEAVDDVRKRLADEGVLVRVEERKLLRRQVAFVPANANAAVWPAVRLAGQLSRMEPMGLPDAALAGLVQVTGLTGHVLWDPQNHQSGLSYLPTLVSALPASFTALLARTEVAVSQVVLTKRA